MCASPHLNNGIPQCETQFHSISNKETQLNVENHSRPRERDTHRDGSYETNKA